jgi:hypothetical protein
MGTLQAEIKLGRIMGTLQAEIKFVCNVELGPELKCIIIPV